MSRRLQNRQRLEGSATAAVAADRWLGSSRRQQALRALTTEAAVQSLLPQLVTMPRIARRLPNGVGRLLEAFTDQPALGSWLCSEQDFFRLCRTVGAVLYGRELARFVDGDDIAALTDDLGLDAWRFGIEHELAADPAADVGASASASAAPRDNARFDVTRFDLSRSDLTDVLLAAGLRAVYTHLQNVLPDQLEDLAMALDLDWGEIDGGGDPTRDDAAVRRVLAHVRTI